MSKNVLTPFIGDMFTAAAVVSRELTGFIPSVAKNTSAERAAVGQTIFVPVSTPKKSKDTTSSMTVSEPDGFTVDNAIIKIEHSKKVEFGFDGEEWRGLENGLGANLFFQQNVEEAIRTLTNQVEADIAEKAAKASGLAVGIAGTTPFADEKTKDFALVRKALNDKGAPQSGRSLVVDGNAGVNILGIPNLTRASEAGTTMTLRQGEIGNVFGISTKETAPIVTMGGSTITNVTLAANEKGTTDLVVKAGSGSLKAGDFITIAGDSTKYGVLEDVTLAANAVIKIARPGVFEAVADGAAVNSEDEAVRNIAFTQNAIQLVTRAPALPSGRDAAIDSYMITDPRSGLAFEIRVYEGELMMKAVVHLAWGASVIQPEHIVTLLG